MFFGFQKLKSVTFKKDFIQSMGFSSTFVNISETA